MSAQPGRKVRGCCCGIPIRIGAALLAWIYFFAGILVVLLAVRILQLDKLDSLDLESGVKALVIALGSLSAFLVITSLFGIVATIGLSPVVARIWSIMFQLWFYLQLALDITVVALLFTNHLDSLIEGCASLSPNARPSSSPYKSCFRARNMLGLYYILSGVVRNAIGYFFVRRVSSFSRDCAERTAANLNVQGGSADSLQGAKAV
ncbi:unnamed protein product [Rhizoctonia solani]|uniref:Uncharacterized protein n=1 Tax=Rhizoctonia solani TaxID=456999 RepID=A0A8H2X1I9_9AGAM|nr:unnamed protein product [Rhizoctonia solani]CAE6474575.1 unnamed protein product [Rhizoctonia solani]